MSATIAFNETTRGRDVASLTLDEVADFLQTNVGDGTTVLIYGVTVTASPTAYVNCDSVTGADSLAPMEWELRSEESLTYEAPSSPDSSDSPDTIFMRVQTWSCVYTTGSQVPGDLLTANFSGTAQDAVFIVAGIDGTKGFDVRSSNPGTLLDNTGDAVLAQDFSNGIDEETGGMLLCVVATSGPTDPIPDADSDEVVAVETATVESEESTTPLRVSLMKIDLAFGSSGWLLGTDNAIRNWILMSDGVANGTFESAPVLPVVTVVSMF
jgi:hypothetical protein